MNLSPAEKELGRQNFAEAIGTTRRDFIMGSLGAVATAGTMGALGGCVSLGGSLAAGPPAGTMGALGGYYFKYENPSEPLRVGIIGVGDEGGVLIGALNPEYVDVVAIADIRPYSIHRAFYGDWYSPGARSARPGLLAIYQREG